jgi:hypothetical protein
LHELVLHAPPTQTAPPPQDAHMDSVVVATHFCPSLPGPVAVWQTWGIALQGSRPGQALDARGFVEQLNLQSSSQPTPGPFIVPQSQSSPVSTVPLPQLAWEQ